MAYTSPDRRQAIIRTNVGILLIGQLGTNFSEILTEIHTSSFKKTHFKMSYANWRSFCIGFNVLNVFVHKHNVELKRRHLTPFPMWRIEIRYDAITLLQQVGCNMSALCKIEWNDNFEATYQELHGLTTWTFEHDFKKHLSQHAKSWYAHENNTVLLSIVLHVWYLVTCIPAKKRMP